MKSSLYPAPDHDYTVVELYEYPEQEIRDWLVDSFGGAGPKTWFILQKKIFFYNQNSHLMFLLRWS